MPASSDPGVSEGTTSSTPSWRSSSSLSSLLPPPTLTDEILDDLAVPQFSLAIVAQKHGLTLSGMLTWLNLPETREVLALRESAAYAHARHVAALNIGHAVEAVASIVRDYNTTRPEREAQNRKTPGFAQRAATNARKAAWLLLQFARIVPVNEADLRRARGTSRVACLLEEQACSESSRFERASAVREPTSATRTATSYRTASVSEQTPEPYRTANVSERTSSSDSTLPSQTVHPAGVLPDLHPASALKAEADSPLASSLKDDANSSMPPALAEWSAHSRSSVPSCAALASTSPPVVHRGDPRGPPR